MPEVNYCPGFGSSSAKLLALGEAPGSHEVLTQIPFSGPSGNLLNQAFNYAGIDRSELYLTNVCKVQPPGNDINRLKELNKHIDDFEPILRQELELIKPNCILAIGGTALTALTGLDGIKHYRGSILMSKYGIKCIPCLHPAALLHSEGSSEGLGWKDFTIIKEDVKRAVAQSQFPQYRIPSRNLHIASTCMDVIRYFERYQEQEKVVIDVETFKTYPMCAGFAFNEYEALSIPLFRPEITKNEKAYIWKTVAEFLADTRIKIIAQNAKFDQKRMRQLGLKWHSCWFSLDMGWHILFPEFPKKLEFIASLITEEPYWKEEGKEYNPKIHKLERWLLYNAKDAAVEYECADKILKELKDSGMESFFWDRIQPLYEIYYDMEDVGFLIDEEIRKHLGKKYNDLRLTSQERLVQNIAKNDKGEVDPIIYENFKDFNVMSNGPKNQVAKLLFGHLRLPVRKDTGDETLKSLANNVVKKQHIKDILMGILQVRKIRKTIGTYINAKTSADKRMHTQCNLNGADTGRTSTGILKPPVSIEKEGIAFQMMTKHEDAQLSGAGGADLRAMFVADKGFSLIEADGSQAEDRVVCVLAKDWQALEDYKQTKFEKNKNGIKLDRHTKTAMDVCSLSFEEITDYQRQIGKKTRHAGNYAMKKHMHMLNLAKFAGVYISEYAAGKQLERFHDKNPKIRSIFHAEIQEALAANDCILYNPFGRRHQFFERWGEELFKEAYAYIPQGTVSDQTKFAMRYVREKLAKYYMKYFAFVVESHDSATALVLDELIPEYNECIRYAMERPINFSKCSLSRDYDLVIPCEIKVGKRWIEKCEEFPDGMEKIA